MREILNGVYFENENNSEDWSILMEDGTKRNGRDIGSLIDGIEMVFGEYIMNGDRIKVFIEIEKCKK